MSKVYCANCKYYSCNYDGEEYCELTSEPTGICGWCEREFEDFEEAVDHYNNKVEENSELYNSNCEQALEIAKLKEQLKNAIVPKFKFKQFVHALYTDADIIKGQIESFDYYTKSYLIFFGDDIGSDWMPESIIFKTKKEAEQRLKELKGE